MVPQARPMDTPVQPKRDRVTVELTAQDRELLAAQRAAIGLDETQVTDGKLILGVYRRFAGQVARPTRR